MQLKAKEAAKLLGVSEKTLYRWIGERRLPALRISGQYRFSRSELLEWASSLHVPVSPDILREPESDHQPAVSLGAALAAGGIHYRVEGTDRDSVMKSAIGLLPLPPEVNRPLMLQMLMARESLSSTGIGNGVAIPHVRNPIVMHIPQPLVALCFLDHPIDFDAIDGKPVHTLFMIVSPTIRAHLRLISVLGLALHNEGFRRAIEERRGRHEIEQLLKDYEQSLPAPGSATTPGEAI